MLAGPVAMRYNRKCRHERERFRRSITRITLPSSGTTGAAASKPPFSSRCILTVPARSQAQHAKEATCPL